MTQMPKASPESADAVAMDRRRETRYAANSVSVIRLLDRTEIQPFLGVVIEVSKSGLRVRTTQRIDRDDRLRIKFGDTVAFAVVRWSRAYDMETFESGLEIDHTLSKHLVERLQRHSKPSEADSGDRGADEASGAAEARTEVSSDREEGIP